MTTVHHPPLKGLGAQHNPNWLWIGLTVIAVLLIVAAFSWTMSSPTLTETATADVVTDIEPAHEVTPARFASPGVTSQYFGSDGLPEADWVRELAVSNPIALNMFRGMELTHEVTAIQFSEPGVTGLYFGNDGLPEADWVRELATRPRWSGTPYR
jgi:hypothetical protein